MTTKTQTSLELAKEFARDISNMVENDESLLDYFSECLEVNEDEVVIAFGGPDIRYNFRSGQIEAVAGLSDKCEVWPVSPDARAEADYFRDLIIPV